MTKNKQTFNIRETAETLIPDKLSRTSYFVSLILVLLMIAGLSTIITKLPQVVPLYFTLPWGEARLAPRPMLYLLPSVSLLVMIVNLALGRLSAKLSPLLPRVLAVAALVTAAMMSVSLIGIIQSLVL